MIHSVAEGIQARLNHRRDAHTQRTTILLRQLDAAKSHQETEKEYIVKADLPDVKKEEIREVVDGDMLTVEGERSREGREDQTSQDRARLAGFVRRFGLPTHVDSANVKPNSRTAC
jgi:HSP20 family molecular chaperone IbpA